MLNKYTETIVMTDGTELYFSVKKEGWHWCVYKYMKKPGGSGPTKNFYEWYFMKYFAERRAQGMWNHHYKMNEKMKFEERYFSHLEVIMEKEDDRES